MGRFKNAVAEAKKPLKRRKYFGIVNDAGILYDGTGFMPEFAPRLYARKQDATSGMKRVRMATTGMEVIELLIIPA